MIRPLFTRNPTTPAAAAIVLPSRTSRLIASTITNPAPSSFEGTAGAFALARTASGI